MYVHIHYLLVALTGISYCVLYGMAYLCETQVPSLLILGTFPNDDTHLGKTPESCTPKMDLQCQLAHVKKLNGNKSYN